MPAFCNCFVHLSSICHCFVHLSFFLQIVILSSNCHSFVSLTLFCQSVMVLSICQSFVNLSFFHEFVIVLSICHCPNEIWLQLLILHIANSSSIKITAAVLSLITIRLVSLANCLDWKPANFAILCRVPVFTDTKIWLLEKMHLCEIPFYVHIQVLEYLLLHSIYFWVGIHFSIYTWIDLLVDNLGIFYQWFNR